MPPPSRTLSAALVAVATSLVLAVPALAQDDDESTTTSSTTTTTAGDDESTTSTSEPDDESTTTTTGEDEEAEASSTTTASTTTTTSTTLPPDVVPPEVQAMIDAYPRTPSGSTDELVAALAEVPDAATTGGFGRFPVGGLATWSHDWLFPRREPSLHYHEGTDVFAERGTPVLAPAAGTATVSTGAVGGLAVKVTQDDGTVWYLAHLGEALVADGTPVTPGVVVGTVGDSGNAKGGAPHVHVEIWPHGGPPLDPKQVLDAYAAEALAGAPAFLAEHRLALQRPGLS